MIKLESVWDMARMADVEYPDSGTSPGAEWLALVHDSAIEQHARGELVSPDESADEITEMADSSVPIRTHTMWQVFVDLCAYRESDDNDPAVALFVIAERFINAMLESASDEAADHE